MLNPRKFHNIFQFNSVPFRTAIKCLLFIKNSAHRVGETEMNKA